MRQKYAFFGLAAAALTLGARPAAQAQTAPAWGAALTASQPFGGTAYAQATAADASGNVYIAGSFSGQVQLGSTTLVSAGGSDVFVAKWNAGTGAWAWAVRAGGTDFDAALGLALSGTTLYLTGYATNDVAGSNALAFGTIALPGKATSASRDLFVAKLTDAGTSATFTWAVNGGGTREDSGTSLAVSGTSVYVGGNFINDTANDQAVSFGALPLNGLSPTSTFNSDVVVAKLVDAGATATWSWVLAAGGTDVDQATSLAVSGTNVYTAGNFNNTSANANGVTFGAVGVVNGRAAAASDDIFVTKIADAGTSAAFSWVQVAGGSDADHANALAVSGPSVYATGYFTNTTSNTNAVTFGAAGALSGLASASSQDVFVAKLTDAGTTGAFAWAQAAGGVGDDRAGALAASGTALYVGGYYTNDSFNNNQVTFGTLGAQNGVTTTLSQDAFVARLTDAGTAPTWGWAQAGGSANLDNVAGLAVSGTSVYPAGTFSLNARFGTATGSPLNSGVLAGDFYVGQLTEAPAGTSAAWARVAQAQVGGSFAGQASAAQGSNVYVTGYFTGSITLGSTTLTAAGGSDVFVAKWNPTTSAWVWAIAGGGFGTDQGTALAVSGTNLYVSGLVSESTTGLNLTTFGTLPVVGMASFPTQDVFVAKLVDAGTSASWSWAQVAGGSSTDQARALAVSGTSLYVAGYFSNSTANGNAVTFGTASLAGLGSYSGNDMFVAKLTDGGSTGAYNWAVAGGGLGTDQARGVAVNGTSVYATGYFTNNAADANAVKFGTASLPGIATTSGNDIFVAKLTDAGTSAAFAWTVANGGLGADQAGAIAVSGTSVYTAGYVTNNAANVNTVAFGPTTLAGATATTSQDAYVAKLTDAGTSPTYGWAAAGGGTSSDQATALAVSGTGVYVAGNYLNTTANANVVAFGSTSLPGYGPTLAPDVFLTKYTDAGATASVAWAQSAGSPLTEQATGLAVSGARLYLTGLTLGAATFAPTALANPYGAQLGFVALLNDTSSPLATAAASSQPAFRLYPNPARAAATVAGLPAKASLQLVDLLGRTITTATADATGTAALALPTSLSPGVYLVRSSGQALRLTVE